MIDKIKQYFPLIIIILLACLIIPIGYYFLYALPKYNTSKLFIEEQKIEYQRQLAEEEKLQAELSKAEKESKLQDCLFEAEILYNNSWQSGCDTWKIQVDKEWENCRSQLFYLETDAENKERCKRTTSDYDLDKNGVCLLPTSRSQTIEDTRKEDKERCYELYKSI